MVKLIGLAFACAVLLRSSIVASTEVSICSAKTYISIGVVKFSLALALAVMLGSSIV